MGLIRSPGLLGLLVSGALLPVQAAPQRLPSVQSPQTRVALLSIFDQLGGGPVAGSDTTRSRANRRHPDVGFISSDPICLSCVLTVLAPPVLPPPAPRQTTPAPKPAQAPAPVRPKPASPQPSVQKPVVSRPPAPKPVTMIEAPLPLTPGQATVISPLEPLPTPVFIELSPLSITPEPLPAVLTTEMATAQTPVQTPGPLPILGVGSAFGVSRRLRGRIKSARRHKI